MVQGPAIEILEVVYLTLGLMICPDLCLENDEKSTSVCVRDLRMPSLTQSDFQSKCPVCFRSNSDHR